MRFARLVGLLVVVSSAVGCGDAPGAPSTPATLNIMLKDTPFADAKAVFVTFSEVSVHQTGGAFTMLPFSGNVSTRTCDLKQLVTAQDVLGTGGLTTGHYTQLRLVVASAALYFDSASSGPACGATLTVPAGRSASVVIPSGEVRLNQEFDVTATKATTILLDLDGGLSINLTGSGVYTMMPVVTVVSVQ